MRPFLITAVVALTAVLVASPPAAGAEDEVDINKEATAYAKAFKKGIKKMTPGDQMEGVDKLIGYYTNEAVDAKGARKTILVGLLSAATVKDSVVVAHTLKALSKTDDGALKILLGVLQRELKKKIPDEKIYETALESLGKLHSEAGKATKALTDLLKHNEDIVVGQAARAIAGYAAASGKTRKSLFEEVLKASEGVYSAAQGSNDRMKRKWNIIGDDVMEALSALSAPPRRIKVDNPQQLRSWFNKKKKISWDPPK